MRYDNAPEKSLVYSVFPHQKSKKKKSTFQKRSRQQSTFVAAAEETKAFPVTPPVPLDNRRSIPEKGGKKELLLSQFLQIFLIVSMNVSEA